MYEGGTMLIDTAHHQTSLYMFRTKAGGKTKGEKIWMPGRITKLPLTDPRHMLQFSVPQPA